ELDADFAAQKAQRQARLAMERQARDLQDDLGQSGILGRAQHWMRNREADPRTDQEVATGEWEPGHEETQAQIASRERLAEWRRKHPWFTAIAAPVPDAEHEDAAIADVRKRFRLPGSAEPPTAEAIEERERREQWLKDKKNQAGAAIRTGLARVDKELEDRTRGIRPMTKLLTGMDPADLVRSIGVDAAKLPGVETLVGKDGAKQIEQNVGRIPLVPTEKNMMIRAPAEQGDAPSRLAEAARKLRERVAPAPAGDDTSDERAKQEIRAEGPLTRAAKALKGYEYEYKPEYTPDNQREGEKNVGPMAQNMMKDPITATAVKERDDGMLKLDTTKLLKLNSAMLSSQSKRIEALEGALTRAAKR
ncbi:MAG: tail fiber domain-containing protein, partial [Giesbergeria sp.]